MGDQSSKTNIKKGFFRLTLVLSMIFGIITPFCHQNFFKQNRVQVNLPEDWNKKSLQERLNSSDGLLLNNAEYFLLSKIEQLNIKRQLKEKIISTVRNPSEFDQYRVGYDLPFKVGWRELSLLGLIGLASIWVIYLFVRWVIIGFVVVGFKSRLPKKSEPG